MAYENKFQYFKESTHCKYGSDWGEIRYRDCYVFMTHKPGTLSSRVLGQLEDLPKYDVSLRLDGDVVQEVPYKEFVLNPCVDEDLEVDDGIPIPAHCPELPSRSTTEIRNLHATSASPLVVVLLGRTSDYELVFPKYPQDMFDHVCRCRGGTVDDKINWLGQMLDCLQALHDLGILHCDVLLRNMLFSDPPVICDLESNCTSLAITAPELVSCRVRTPTSNHNVASDIYAVAFAIWQMHSCDNPRIFEVQVVPYPFTDLYNWCQQPDPADRPTIAQIRVALSAIAHDTKDSTPQS
nr:serine/threonine protein kinase [Cryptococcus depauperatus CBS 7841]